MIDMTSNRPYLVRAIYDWISDNNMTPHMLVNAAYNGVQVPADYIQDGRIVLNVAARAASQFSVDNSAVSFSARFAGKPQTIHVPIDAVLAIYAQENGQGMAFDALPSPDPEPPAPGGSDDDGNIAVSRSHLKVVK